MATRNVLEAYGSDIIGSHIEVGGSSGGGHEIMNQLEQILTQRPTLQMMDIHTSDDSVNLRTELEVIKKVTKAEFDTLGVGDDGFYMTTDEEDISYTDPEEDSVSVTADGNKTYATLLNELFALVDVTKITEHTVIYKGDDNFWFNLSRMESDNTLHFGSVMNYGSYFRNFAIEMNASGSKYMRLDVQGGSSNTITDSSTSKPTNGTVITLYYGTSSSIINLKTDADNCMMSDGVTSVNDMLETSAEVLDTGITITRCGKMRTLVVNGEFTVSTATVSGFVNKIPAKDRPIVSLQLFGLTRYNSKYYGLYGSLESSGNLIVFGVDNTTSGGYVYLTGTPELRFSITYMVA